MDDSYYIDLGKFAIEKYKNVLERVEILPSRMILKEKITERIQCLKENGIKNLEDLISVLKTTIKYLMSLNRGLNHE